ncbi:MAG: hypothetical protein NDJ89_13650 [Oligoflexia bacterium]|nr:hypothetical protein [Oligoflexia bacterium]
MNTYASDFHSPRTAALGGAGHAGPILNDAIYLNPSYVSFLPSYSLAFNFQWFDGGGTLPSGESELHGRTWNLSIQDGRSELFQAGAAYTHRDNGNFIHVGASKAVVNRMGLGLGWKFFRPLDGSRAGIHDAIFSTTVLAASWLQVVGIVDNLFESEEGRRYGLYREFILGAKANVMGIALIYFDPHHTPNLPEGAWGHELGIEFTPYTDFFIRFGNFRNAALPHLDQLRGHGYGFGLGWISPRISFDYGLSRVLSGPAYTVHSAGATLYF